MRLGLFGGTFDPVHWGHLRSAEEVRESCALDEVCFVPCGAPPHRSAKPAAAARHRLEMVRLAVEDNPGLNVSDTEVARPGNSYSIDTVRRFSKDLTPADSLYFILGLDAFLLIDGWKDWRELLRLTHVRALATHCPTTQSPLSCETPFAMVRCGSASATSTARRSCSRG